MTFTSLVGARRKSTLPANGSRPNQFEKSTKRKTPAKSGTYRAAAGPPSEVAKFDSIS